MCIKYPVEYRTLPLVSPERISGNFYLILEDREGHYKQFKPRWQNLVTNGNNEVCVIGPIYKTDSIDKVRGYLNRKNYVEVEVDTDINSLLEVARINHNVGRFDGYYFFVNPTTVNGLVYGPSGNMNHEDGHLDDELGWIPSSTEMECCGRWISLDGFTNGCPVCHQEYNFSGQKLAPREQWENW
jgi:hypothetical protein